MLSCLVDAAGALIRVHQGVVAALASRPCHVGAPPCRRLRHDLVDQCQQQLVLGGVVLVERPQRGLGPLTTASTVKSVRPVLAEDRQG